MSYEVAIYATSSATAGLYDRAHGRSGGAERQMTLLARALTEQGRRVAHIIHKPRDPVELPYPLTLVHRDPYAGGLREPRALWRALRRADAEVVVLRSASPLVAVGALYGRRNGRRVIFSASNVSDFTMEKMSGRPQRALYGLGLRAADAVVVQSEDQRELALRAFPSLPRVVPIPSFAELAPETSPHPGEAFLWFGRAVAQKQPERYVELARCLPEARFRMILVDDGGDGKIVESVRADAAGLENLELLDPLPHASLAPLVARSAAVVNTSTLEGMPNTFLEAWAGGVPVLTLQFDPDELVARHDLGVSARGSWERFVAGARSLWQSRADRDALALRARAYLHERHSPEAVGASWAALVDEVRCGR